MVGVCRQRWHAHGGSVEQLAEAADLACSCAWLCAFKEWRCCMAVAGTYWASGRPWFEAMEVVSGSARVNPGPAQATSGAMHTGSSPGLWGGRCADGWFLYGGSWEKLAGGV